LDYKNWNGSEDCEKKPVKKYCEIVALNRIENMDCTPLLVTCSPKMPENDQNEANLLI
jgi:hypothetical protein